ncbi:MAG: O-antigen ligase family protein [Brevinema sp.]
MLRFIKKYPTESMGMTFSTVFLLLALVSYFIIPINQIVIIPLFVSITIFTLLLLGSVGMYLFSVGRGLSSWKKWAEVFIMLAALCASLSDLFWIFSAVAAVIIIVGNLSQKTLTICYPIIYTWFVLIGVAFVSSFFAVESKVLSFGATFGLVLYSFFFIAVYNQNFLQERGEEFVQRIGVLLSFSIMSTVIFSLWHYGMPYSIDVLIFRFQPSTGTDSLGMASIYGHWPTHSSAFLSLVFWALIGIYCFSTLSPIRKKIIIGGIVLTFVGSMATLSRNAFLFLALSIGITLLILIIKTNKKKWWYLLGGCGLFFVGILTYLVTYFPKWRELFTDPFNQVTIVDRLEQYQFALAQLPILEYPLIGIGLMNFGPYYRMVMQNEYLTDYLHQLLLSITLEIGYLGLLCFTVLLFLIGKNIVTNYRDNKRNLIFVVVFFAWIATGLFDNWLYFMWSSTLFMILIALGSKPLIKKEL